MTKYTFAETSFYEPSHLKFIRLRRRNYTNKQVIMQAVLRTRHQNCNNFNKYFNNLNVNFIKCFFFEVLLKINIYF